MGKGRTICSNGEITADSAEASRRNAQELVAALQPDERQALKSIVEGCSLVRIAGQLGVSLEDAIRLKASLMNKLGVNVTADLVRIGIYARVDADR